MSPTVNEQQIVTDLAQILQPGQVTEVRALDAIVGSDWRPQVYSGYFDDLVKLAKAVGTIRSAKGIYFIPNVVNKDLLARACNRLRAAGKEPLTSDSDIVRRRYLLIDVDPVRPAGISSSNREHEAAHSKAKDIRDAMAAEGWPLPIFCDSGNGAHLLYPINEPADDGELVKRCLQKLAARFNDGQVSIDTTVSNPARILKLPGTWACKGDNMPDRPHRIAKLLSSPTTLVVVSHDCLLRLADFSPSTSKASLGTCRDVNAAGGFDLEKWIADHGIAVRGPEAWKDGRRWVLSVCPWNSSHTNDSAYIIQQASGAIGAGCHHNSCQGKGWRELRDAIEPGWRDRRRVDSANITGNAATDAWPEVLKFDELGLPEFPTRVLPKVLREWVDAESHATQTPPDLAGFLSLAVFSTCIARRVEVEPRPGWREPVNLFTAVLLEPGNRKSAVFSDALKPLRELEAELIDAARPNVARQQSDRRQDEARLRKLEKLAAEGGDAENRYEAGNLAAKLAGEAAPVLPRLLVDDATAEKLGMMLAEQGGRIASMSPEGGVFDLMKGMYSKSGVPQFGVYLMGHSGDDLITDRVCRQGVRVERPALTCAYAMQPAVTNGLANNEAFRGRGLLARFLYAAPKSWIGQREVAPCPVSDDTREAYRQTVRALARSCGNIGSASETFVLRLSPEAVVLLHEWEAEIEEMLGDGGRMELIRDWGAKLAGATIRLAAVLHCVQHGPAKDIEGSTIRAAIEIARYLIPHAEAVLNMMLAREAFDDDDARYVLKWIERHGRREFTKSEAQHHGKRRFRKADDIDGALAELVRRGYIRRKPAEPNGPGRPASPSYEVNPSVIAGMEAEKRSRNSQNPADESECGNSGNIGSAPVDVDSDAREQVTV